jgi:SAM-dependent methyltransferase
MTDVLSAQEYWEDFYRNHDQVWSGRANSLLVREVEGLAPGTALDLGSGEGGDAVWLAQRGWRVTATDVSAVALDRGQAHAAELGVAERITWERHDLSTSFPAGTFDLVSAQYLHSPVSVPGERETILRRAPGAVAAGGRLLIVGHAGWPTFVDEPPFEYHFPTTAEVLRALDIDMRHWRVEVEEVVERELTGPEGEPGTRADNILELVATTELRGSD